MTDDELDLIASAYVDGEATPDEVALVERDPDLQARVETFRRVQTSEATIPPPGLADRHLRAALAEFEAVMASDGAVMAGDDLVGPRPAAETSAGVFDLRERAAGPADGHRPDRVRTRASRHRVERPSAFPNWLAAAAAVGVIGGGVVWAVGRTGSDDSFETAGDSGQSADDSDAASDETAALESAPAADGGSDAAGSSSAEMAVTDEAMEESTDDSGDDGSGDADADTAVPTTSAPTTAANGSRRLPPVRSFDEVPDPDSIEDLPALEPDLSLSFCEAEVTTAGLGQLVGFLPVEVVGEPAELFVFIDDDGAEIRLLVDADCQPLTP